MRRIFAYLVIIALALMGIAYGQDFVKGTEKGGPVQLSGLSPDVFDGSFFASEGWWMDGASYGMTPSMAAFLADNPEDGRPNGNVTPKHAYVGSAWKGKA